MYHLALAPEATSFSHTTIHLAMNKLISRNIAMEDDIGEDNSAMDEDDLTEIATDASIEELLPNAPLPDDSAHSFNDCAEEVYFRHEAFECGGQGGRTSL